MENNKKYNQFYNFMVYISHKYIVPIIYDFFKINNPKSNFKHLLKYLISSLKIKHKDVYDKLKMIYKIIIINDNYAGYYNFDSFITDLIPDNELINGEYIFKKSLNLKHIDFLFSYHNIKLLDSIYL